MDREAYQAIVHGVAKSWTLLSIQTHQNIKLSSKEYHQESEKDNPQN